MFVIPFTDLEQSRCYVMTWQGLYTIAGRNAVPAKTVVSFREECRELGPRRSSDAKFIPPANRIYPLGGWERGLKMGYDWEHRKAEGVYLS